MRRRSCSRFVVTVSISLSSGFSFQVRKSCHRHRWCLNGFNLVIERLLISGSDTVAAIGSSSGVSISLSSGFSFQVQRGGFVLHLSILVSISLSSGFSFQDNRHATGVLPLCKFQSRYRAASHFRPAIAEHVDDIAMFQSRYRAASHFRLISIIARVYPFHSFNLVIERLLISGYTF